MSSKQGSKTKSSSKANLKAKCTSCGEEKAKATGYYVSHSSLYRNNDGKHTICKDCIIEKYNDLVKLYSDEKMALYHLCLMLDIYYNNDLCDSAYIQAMSNGSGNLAKIYFQKVNSLYQYKGKSSIDSERFRGEFGALPTNESNSDEEILELEEDLGIVVDTAIIRRWGSGMTHDDYVFLETTYLEFTDSYECRTPAQRLIFRQIAKCLLEGEKARKTGNTSAFEKMNSMVSKLMTDGNIKPIQEASVAEDDTASWGKWINLIEQERPIGEASEQFKDVDKIGSYITTWFTRQMQRVLDLGDDSNDNEN